MPRKIVIIPTFASSHFLKCWIPNVIEVLNPDVIIINEGLFPGGPENKGHIDEEFRKKYLLPQPFGPKKIHSGIGFDWIDTVTICTLLENKYKIQILLNSINFNNSDVNTCFLQSMTYFHGFVPEPGDVIVTLEPDAFLFEGDKDILDEEISKLKPGQGLRCVWRDFLETQYYCEAINEVNPKIRRFCYCFDNMDNYKKAMNGFMSQSYPLLQYTDKFWVRHYPWFVHSKWKELRYELIYRNDPQYWKDFENGLQEIRINSDRQLNLSRYRERIKDENLKYLPKDELMQKFTVPRPPDNRVLIRPSRQDEGRWAKFIDIEHPKHIQNHPNFVK